MKILAKRRVECISDSWDVYYGVSIEEHALGVKH